MILKWAVLGLITCHLSIVTSQIDMGANMAANAENMLTNLMGGGAAVVDPGMPATDPVLDPMLMVEPPMVDCTGIQCSPPLCPVGVQPVLLEGQCCPGCPPNTFQSNEFTKEQLQTMLRLMREEGKVFNLQGQPAGFGEPVLSESRLLEFLQKMEAVSGGTALAGGVTGVTGEVTGASGGEASNMIDLNLFPSGARLPTGPQDTPVVDTVPVVVDTGVVAADVGATSGIAADVGAGGVVMVDGTIDSGMTADTSVSGDTVIIRTDPGATAVVSGMDLQPVDTMTVTETGTTITDPFVDVPVETVLVDNTAPVVDLQIGGASVDVTTVDPILTGEGMMDPAIDSMLVDTAAVSAPVDPIADPLGATVALDSNTAGAGNEAMGFLDPSATTLVSGDASAMASVDPVAAIDTLDALFAGEPVSTVVTADGNTGGATGTETILVAQPVDTFAATDVGAAVVDPAAVPVDSAINTVMTADTGNVILQPTDTVITTDTGNIALEPAVVSTSTDAAVNPDMVVDAGVPTDVAPTVVDTSVVDPMVTGVDIVATDPSTVVDTAAAVVEPMLVAIEPVPVQPLIDTAVAPADNTVVTVDGTSTVDAGINLGDSPVSSGTVVAAINTEPVVNSGIETVAVVGEPTSPVEAPVTVEAGPRLVVIDSVATNENLVSEPVAVNPASAVETVVIDTAPIVEIPAVDVQGTATIGETRRIVTVEQPVVVADPVPTANVVDTPRLVVIEQPIRATVDTSATGILDNTIISATGNTASTSNTDAATIIRPNTRTRTSSTSSRTSILSGSAVGTTGVIDDSSLLTSQFDNNMDFGREWLKARVDSAPCARYNCNLPICYVPHDTDCKSYIVCQRTALGTYVAWKMRCAFGSFWGSGKMWTCERVEDLAGKGYTCPNDPCRNSDTLTTYPDEDEKNCRTYWRCENGISKPACCPPGMLFDRTSLKCENDPMDTCRSPCPLKIEGCSVAGARTQPFYDGNCRTYWDCENGHPHPVCCPPGMSYNSETDSCIVDEFCKAECPPEYTGKVCGKVAGETVVTSYALTDGNCRTYMKCNSQGFDEAYCCRQEHYYDAASGQCLRILDQSDPCNIEICPASYKEECRFTAVPDSPAQFYDTDAGIVLDCAPSTTFAEEICTCDGSSLIRVCKNEVWAKFDNLADKWSVKNYGDGWISVFGDMTKNRTSQGVTYGTFDGSSGMEVWRYDHTALPEISLELTFQPVASGNSRQVLVSNCMSVDNSHPSFEVALDPQTSNVEIIGKSKINAAQLTLPYDNQGWNKLKLFFDGDNFVGAIEDPTGVNRPSVQTTRLRGEITAGVGALKFGPCLDSFSVPQKNGFTGFVSEVKFSKCLDTAGSEFIQTSLAGLGQ